VPNVDPAVAKGSVPSRHHREWYERRGYRETSRLPLAALYPEDGARLLVAEMDVVTMRKPL
jgi:hypothetical protein